MWKKRNSAVNSLEDYFRQKHGNINDFLDNVKIYELPGVEEAVGLIKKFQKYLFYIIGDYDVDGITATAIMKIGLERFGCKVMYRIPKRFSEGSSQWTMESVPQKKCRN